MQSSDFAPGFPGTLIPTRLSTVAFVPTDLPPGIALTPAIQLANERALVALGALGAVIPSLPNPHLIMRREAVHSSKIEGTQTELAGLLMFEEVVTGTDADGHAVLLDKDAREVHNYVRAQELGLSALHNLPVCTRLIRDMHSRLMEGVTDGRGSYVQPGEYRNSQAFMGSNDIRQARYVAPPEDQIDDLMNRLEKYVNTPSALPTLIDIAMIHYQFEAIHPFADGNGRLGRLLISLLLAARGTQSEPVLYLSAYFERNKMEYVNRMWRISCAGEWNEWIGFFLEGVRTEAEDLAARARGLLVLREAYRQQLHQGRAAKQLELLDALFRWPIITVNRASEILNMTHQGATKHVRSLEQKGILREVTGNERNRMYIARGVVELLS